MVTGNHEAGTPVPVSRAFAAAGMGALACGALSMMLAKIMGVSPSLAALGGAMLGGVGAFAAVAQRKIVDPEEDLPLADSGPGGPEISGIAAYLREHLGTDITAYLSGAPIATDVDRWASGEAEPGAVQGSRLIHAYEAARLIVNSYDGETARAWFFGMNQRLDDEAPAYLLRHGSRPEDWRFILPAAREFVESAH